MIGPSGDCRSITEMPSCVTAKASVSSAAKASATGRYPTVSRLVLSAPSVRPRTVMSWKASSPLGDCSCLASDHATAQRPLGDTAHELASEWIGRLVATRLPSCLRRNTEASLDATFTVSATSSVSWGTAAMKVGPLPAGTLRTSSEAAST